MIDRGTTEALFRRIFRGGVMRRLPRRREDAEVVLAMSVSDLDPAQFFDESEINVRLSAWLEGIAAERELDHIIMRRYLVDFGLLRRTSDGAIYRVRSERIDEILSPDARKVDVTKLFEEVEAARRQRKQVFRR